MRNFFIIFFLESAVRIFPDASIFCKLLQHLVRYENSLGIDFHISGGVLVF